MVVYLSSDMSDTSDTKQASLASQLQAFGLNQTEASIYLHLVGKPAKTMLELSRDLNLPRTSVYDNSVKLAEKGLIQKVVTFKSQKLQAYPPSILRDSLEKQKNQVEELQQKLNSLEASLAQTIAVPANTEVRYFYGQKGFQQMMWNALKGKEHVGYSQFGRIEIVGEAFTKRNTAELIARGIRDRVISNPEIVTKYVTSDTSNDIIRDARKEYQNIRTIDSDKLYVSGDITIYNNVFAVAYWKQGEVVGVEIENAELVKTQKSIFELLWQIAQPIKYG